MTSKQKAKGYKYEKKTEEILNEISGVIARRNIMSGSLKNYSTELDGDIRLIINPDCEDCRNWSIPRKSCIKHEITTPSQCKEFTPDKDIKNLKVEVKARSKDFPKWIEDSLTQGDLTVIWKLSGSGTKAEPFVLMRLETFKELIE